MELFLEEAFNVEFFANCVYTLLQGLPSSLTSTHVRLVDIGSELLSLLDMRQERLAVRFRLVVFVV